MGGDVAKLKERGSQERATKKWRSRTAVYRLDLQIEEGYKKYSGNNEEIESSHLKALDNNVSQGGSEDSEE